MVLCLCFKLINNLVIEMVWLFFGIFIENCVWFFLIFSKLWWSILELGLKVVLINIFIVMLGVYFILG